MNVTLLVAAPLAAIAVGAWRDSTAKPAEIPATDSPDRASREERENDSVPACCSHGVHR